MFQKKIFCSKIQALKYYNFEPKCAFPFGKYCNSSFADLSNAIISRLIIKESVYCHLESWLTHAFGRQCLGSL